MDHLGASDQLSAPTRDYVASAIDTLGRLLDREAANIATAAEWLADAVGSGGLIRLFATGHSSLLIQDLFYRAGGLAPVDAILEDSVTGYRDVTKSEHVERLEGFAPLILDHRRLEPNDALVVFSQSGRNAVPIEVAQQARVRGLHTIAVTSLAHATGQTSRHSSGMHLYDVAELVIDTGTPLGDCAVSLPNHCQPSSVALSVTSSRSRRRCACILAVRKPRYSGPGTWTVGASGTTPCSIDTGAGSLAGNSLESAHRHRRFAAQQSLECARCSGISADIAATLGVSLAPTTWGRACRRSELRRCLAGSDG